MSSTQHQLIKQCATRLRGIVEALDNIHDSTPHRWSTDLDDVHSSAESLLALIKDQAPARSETSFEEWLANELEGEDGQPVPAAVCDITLARRAFNHWPKLEQPAKVGGVRFSAGVSSRLVVEAAQRLYEFESTPEKEAERIDPEQESVEQAGGDERVIGWRERILAAHPNSDPGFWTDALLVEHMAAEIADLRAALAQPSQAQAEQAEGAHVPDEVSAGVFAEWWEEEGQYCRAGGGDYERTFAFQAWRHLYPLLLQARAALAQPSPVRSSLLINGYQLRAALDFIAPDGTAEQLESEACIEWRQQDADFLEAGLYAFCAEYPEEGGVLLDEEPTTAQPSPLQSEQAEAERPEVVAYRTIGRHTKHQHPHYALNYYKQNAEDQAAHWRERGCEVSEDELMTVAQHERIVGALRAENAKLSEALDRWPLIRDSLKLRLADALARVAELEGKLTDWVHEGFRLNEALAVAKAQHSVPDDDMILQIFADNAEHSEQGDEHGYCIVREQHAQAIARKLLAAAPGNSAQHSVPEGLALIPVRETEAMHDAVMALLYKGVARTDTQKLLDAYIAAAPGKEVPQAWLDVQAERRRQVEAEGWTPEHDDQHSHGQMARAAACYALAGSSAPNDETAALLVSLAWPWDEQWWKPSTARRDLIKAGALVLAEIERLDRAGISQSPQPGATTASS
ncbi:TPA: hypothetical protein ACRMKO_000579 [Pseudomonas aeruginosa]